MVRRTALILCLVAAAAATISAEQLPIRTYTTADGLASDTVYRVFADSRGFLWFCTSDGLSRFDGYTFTSYSTRDGLPDRRVSDVCESRDGSLWVATAGGLCRFVPRASAGGSPFAIERLADALEPNEINCLLEARDGVLWCGTEGGLYRLEAREGGWSASHVALGTDDAVNALTEDAWGGVWAGTAGEVRLVRPDGRVEAHVLPGVGRNAIRSIHVDAEGRLWAGTWIGICHSAPRASADDPVTLSESGRGAPAGWGNAFFESHDGTLWVATTRGLWRKTGADGVSFERRAAVDGACDRDIWDMTEDRDGNLWLATSCGVLRMDSHGFTGYTKADGLASINVNSIFESNTGELIVTTSYADRMIHRFDGARFTSAAPKNLPKSYPGWGWGQTVMQDREGAWWVPIGMGVFRYPTAAQPDAAVLARPEPIFAGREVFRVFEDSRGDVWFVQTAPPGLLRWDRATRRVVDLTGETGMPVCEFSSFCESRDGAVWVGTSVGALLRYVNGRFETFTEADGVPAGWLRALYIDRVGRLWIASSLGGLARVDDPTSARPQFTAYTTAEGLSSDNVWSVVEDEWGRIYAGTTRGVDRLVLATGAVKHYTSADGLPTSQIFCAYRDRFGSLWFGSTFGLVRFDPEPIREREPPRTLVTGLRVAGVARPVSALGEFVLPALELDPNENNVSLDYLGLGTSLGEELRYQHRLEGADADWSAPTAERTVTFANLSPGTYRLLVRAVDADGVASPEPASFEFTVLAPVWRRWWFLALVGTLAALAAYGLYRYRVTRLLEVERVRTRIATDLHDDIGSNLTRIAFLSEVGGYGDARTGEGPDPLRSIARISRESVSAMNDIVWAIDPNRDSFRDLARRMRKYSEETFVSRDIALEFSADDDDDLRLGNEVRRQIYLIFKEAVNNAVRHSGCERVEVSFHVGGRRLALEISDDGHGFDPSRDRDGNGLRNIRRRAAAVGGDVDIRSDAGGGTRISLSVPIHAPTQMRRWRGGRGRA